MRSKKAVIFILVGIAIAAVPFFLRMRERQRTGQYISQFEEEENEESEETGNRKKKASPYLAEGAVGIVEIPELEIKYPVFEGTGAVQLNEGIGHMESTAPLCGTKQNKYLVGDAQDMELPFTVAVTPFEKENSNIRGLARIYIADCFAVSNISLIMGKNGLFVSMPSYKTNQIDENNRSVYRDICFPVTAEFRGKLNTLLTDAYEKAVAEVQEQIRGQEEGFMPAQDFPDMDLPTR